jgi:hypothetical protein
MLTLNDGGETLIAPTALKLRRLATNEDVSPFETASWTT